MSADLGNPISYEVLEQHTPVFSSDGEQIGTVEHVLAVEAEDVFDGIVVTREGGGGHVFADADDVGSIYERGVILKLTAEACMNLPQPSENPAVMFDDPADASKHGKLRRAWDLLSGNY
jgi:hypothetical protein